MALAHRSVPARGALGCVLSVEAGIYQVWTSRGCERASMSGSLLADVARDCGARPAPGDWVRLTRWHDGRLTLAGRAACRQADQPRPRLRLVRGEG